MRPTLTTALLICVAATSSCRSPTAISDHGFTVSGQRTGLLFRNESPGVVHYAAFDGDPRVGILLTPPKYWPTLAPRETKTLPYSELPFYHSGSTRALVYWSLDGRSAKNALVDIPHIP